MSYLKKYFLIIVLVILILVLVFLKIRYGSTNTGKTETTEDKAKPTIEIIGENNQNNVTITEQRSENNQTTIDKIDKIDINSNPAEIDSNKQENDFTDSADYGYSLQPLLPYQGKYFRVEKYFKKGYLEAITKTDDLVKAEEELKTWIDDNEPFPGETKYIFILK